MTDAPPDTAWFEASSTAEQAHALDAIVAAANGATGLPFPDRLRHASALIELAHLNRHPRTRVPILRALGCCEGQFIAIPALQAELDDPAVALTAVEGLGRVGLALGGVAVARWYAQQRPDHLSPELHAAVLLALARTGHPDVDRIAVECWQNARMALTSLHSALAVAASSALVDDAEECLHDPEAAPAAALHLAATHHPHLAKLLKPLRAHADPQLALLVDALLQAPRLNPQDLLLQLLGTPLPPRALGRAARRLKVHPTDRVVRTFTELCFDPRDPEARHQVSVAMASGIPPLQDAALDLAAAGPPDLLTHALRHAHLDTARLRAGLREWLGHDDDRIAKAAVRAYLSALHQPDALGDALAASHRAVLRLEWVRLQQSGLRDQTDRSGRSTLPHKRQQALTQRLRQLITEDPDPGVRRLSLYTAGNLGLTGLTSVLIDTAVHAPEPTARQAAATALGQFAAPTAVAALTEALRTETEDIVVFRLARALIRALRDQHAPSPEVARAALARLPSANPHQRLILVTLLGHCRDPGALDALRPLATDRSQAIAAATITAIGRLGDPRGLDVLIQASKSPDPERRLRATDALGAIGGDVAVDRLAAILGDRDEDTEVRHLAADGLRRTRSTSAAQVRLPRPDLDDPCAIDILALQHADNVADIDTAQLDASLQAAIPGFDPRALGNTAPDALNALRTAEFFHQPGVRLPEGVDKAPPVLLWVKGMEIWLHARLSPLLHTLHRPPQDRLLAALQPRWTGLRSTLAPAWADPSSWDPLCENLARALLHKPTRVQSLRIVAGALLVADGLVGLRWDTGLSAPERAALAHDLVRLAHQRNPLTHQKAGTKKDQVHTRDLAIQAARRVVRLKA